MTDFEEETYVGIRKGPILRYQRTYIDAYGNLLNKPLLKISINNGTPYVLDKHSLLRMIDYLEI